MSGAEDKTIHVDEGREPLRDPYVQRQAVSLKCDVEIKGSSFKDFLRMVSADGIDLTRNPDTGRDVEL